MRWFVAWRILSHERGRSVLAITGIFVAILLIFLQLGFYNSVPEGGMLFYNALRFDIVLTSREYVFQAQSNVLPRRRLYQALSLPEVADVAPLYQRSGSWVNLRERLKRTAFIMGFRPEDRVFDLADVERRHDLLRQPDVVLMDRNSRPEFGPIETGSVAEVNGRRVRVGGQFNLGTGFVGLGVVVVSDQNFLRLFPQHSLDRVSFGLVRLQPGSDPDRVAAGLRRILPDDTSVFTRSELASHEVRHWVMRTSTGLVFGFGVIVAFIVGLVILFQTLSTQITRHLPEFATLKAIGYGERDLGGIVVAQAILMTAVAVVPACVLATAIYAIMRVTTVLPIFMTLPRIASVLALAFGMTVGSALLSLRVLRRADPVDLF